MQKFFQNLLRITWSVASTDQDTAANCRQVRFRTLVFSMHRGEKWDLNAMLPNVSDRSGMDASNGIWSIHSIWQYIRDCTSNHGNTQVGCTGVWGRLENDWITIYRQMYGQCIGIVYNNRTLCFLHQISTCLYIWFTVTFNFTFTFTLILHPTHSNHSSMLGFIVLLEKKTMKMSNHHRFGGLRVFKLNGNLQK